MRTDQGVLKDPRVRRAVALTINRPQQLAKVMLGAGQVGNDNPFWKGFASTDPSIKQRTQNLKLAKALAQGGRSAENLKFNITTWNFLDHTDHAASIQAYAREAGIEVGIEVMDVGKYYDSEPAGADYASTTPWLNRTVLADRVRGARRSEHLPHAVLHVDGRLERVALQERGVRLAREDVPRGSRARGSAEGDEADGGLLLRDTPVITDYFINYVTASSSKVKNYVPEGLSHVRLAKVSLA